MFATHSHSGPFGTRLLSRPSLLGVLLVIACAGAALAQGRTARSSQVEDLLLRALGTPSASAAAASSQSLEIRVRWHAYGGNASIVRPGNAPPAAGAKFVVRAVRQIPEPVVQSRVPELSTEHLLVAAVDAGGQLQGWALVIDPRILRSEQTGPNGTLNGQVLHHTQPEFLVVLPDNPTITELRFYRIARLGQDFDLELLDVAPFHP